MLIHFVGRTNHWIQLDKLSLGMLLCSKCFICPIA
uniref:Uncharacterized protein n=1 Tax=Setaria italica TaxID=4555 RepID=K3XU57_SETIT